MNTIAHKQKQAQRGQSLVEVALFFPIFIILLAGLVEVSQLLITQNRVSSAARAGARFASNGGEDVGILNVVLNTVTQTLDMDENVWDVWVIRGAVDENGTGIIDWEFTHEYGISNTVRSTSIDPIDIQARILAELQQDENKVTDVALAQNLKFVATYVIHDVESILGLDALPQYGGVMSREALSVMRITAEGNAVTNGCDAFPIAVHKGIRSVTPPGTGTAFDYPNANDFTYPGSNRPTYQEFFNNVPDQDLPSAQPGYVYKIYNGSGQGNFGWLTWNQALPSNANTLTDSLNWPGNSTDYNDYNIGGNTGPIDGWNDPDPVYIPLGYIEPGDVTDQSLHEGDFVAGDNGISNSINVRNALNEHIDLERTLRVIVWDTATANGNNAVYHIDPLQGFAVFRLIGYNLSQNWILAEFVRWDDSCGQVAAGN